MEYVFTPLWVLLDLLTLVIFSQPFFTPRNNRRKCVSTFIIIWGVMSIYLCILPDGFLHRFLSLGCSFLLLFFMYKGSIQRYLLCFSIYYIFIGIIDIVFTYGICMLLNISYSELIWKKLLFISVGTITKLFENLLAYLFRKYYAQKGIGSIQNKWLILTLLFPISSLLMMLVIFVAFQDQQDLSVVAFTYGCIVSISNVAILYLINIMEKRTKEEQQLIILNQQMDIQIKSIAALDQSYRNQRRVTHEYMHQLQTIIDLLDQGEESAVRQYIAGVQGSQRTKSLNVNTNNPILDAILNQKYQWATEHDIKMQFQINDLSTINLGMDELVVLFSNLLDNAIEACLKLPDERTIICSIIQRETLFISIRNTSAPVTIINGIIETSKEPRSEHGFGLPNICHIITMLDAEYAYHYEDGWFHFVAEIPLERTK